MSRSETNGNHSSGEETQSEYSSEEESEQSASEEDDGDTDGDRLKNIMENVLKEYIEEKDEKATKKVLQLKEDLIETCSNMVDLWKLSTVSSVPLRIYPIEPLVYLIDLKTKKQDILDYNSNPPDWVTTDWLTALTNPKQHHFNTFFPIPIHSNHGVVHSTRLQFSLEAGDHINIEKETINIIKSPTHHTILKLSPDQKEQLLNVLQGTINSDTFTRDPNNKDNDDSNKLGVYHGRIRGIALTGFINDIPISLAATLITTDPITNESKTWCNTKQMNTCRSSSFSGTSAFNIPACKSSNELLEPIWTPPPQHTHPDLSRWLNVNYTELKDKLASIQLGGAAPKTQIGKAIYSIYEVIMPELTSIVCENIIQFIVMDRYADILLRTRAIPYITELHVEEFTKYHTDFKSFKILKCVMDSIVIEYEPFMRQSDYLMSFSGDIALLLLPERSKEQALADLQRYISNKQTTSGQSNNGQLNITIQIEYEKYTTPPPAFPIVVAISKKKKKKKKSKTKNKETSKTKEKVKKKSKSKSKSASSTSQKNKVKPRSHKKASLLQGIKPFSILRNSTGVTSHQDYITQEQQQDIATVAAASTEGIVNNTIISSSSIRRSIGLPTLNRPSVVAPVHQLNRVLVKNK